MAKPKRARSGSGDDTERLSAVKASTPKNGKKTKKKNPWLRAVRWVLVGLLALGLVGVGAVAFAYVTIQIPDPNADFQTNTTFVYYNDGKERIGSFQVQNRQSITYAEMPQYVKDAIVAGENRSFWTDPGISVTGLFRAALGLVGLAPSDVTDAGGGSTITQQYIKLLYLTQEKTFTRKAKEILLAAKMGQQLTKEQILTGYLNTVYFGRGAYGIQAAAHAYFNKDASKLDLAESVALAAIVNLPGRLDPATGAQAKSDLLQRYQYILNGMVDMGVITASQRAEVYTKLPAFPKVATDSRMGGPKGFLLQMVQDELRAKGFTDDQINGGGLKVVTTFDASAQADIVSAAQKTALDAAGGDKKKAAELHPGIASIDNATGGVLALYGGPDYVKNSRNWATTTSPTGSTFKPYTLATALADGWTLSDRVNGNSPLFLPGVDDTRGIRNAGNQSYGNITLLEATTHSVNTAFVNLATQLTGGYQSILDTANDAGAPTEEGWDPVATATLGTPEVSPVYQAAAYSTFANEGVRRTPHVISQVFDAQGKSLYQAGNNADQTIASDVAVDVTYALEHVAEDGTGRRASYLGFPVAGKTGTAYNSVTKRTTAAWFVGFTKQITTAVMYVKGDKGTGDLGTNFYGSGYPALTWLNYMKLAMAGKDSQDFSTPTHRVSTQKPTHEATKKTSSATSSATSTPTATDTATDQPTTTEPTTTEPTKPAPSTDKPTTDKPTTDKPTTDPPKSTSSSDGG